MNNDDASALDRPAVRRRVRIKGLLGKGASVLIAEAARREGLWQSIGAFGFFAASALAESLCEVHQAVIAARSYVTLIGLGVCLVWFGFQLGGRRLPSGRAAGSPKGTRRSHSHARA
jgi:hypothetical protein